MKIKKSVVIAMALFLATSISVYAQHDHKSGETHQHAAPHGGQVLSAGKYHLELVRTKDKIGEVFTIYLLDSAEKTLTNKGKTGVLFIQTAEAKSSQETLATTGDDKFVFTYKGEGNIINAIVSIKWGEEAATAKFQWQEMKAPAKEKHQNNDGHNHQH